MSRSYKKTPVCTSANKNGYKKKAKRLANRKIRRSKYIQNGKWYKKMFCRYDINEQRWIMTLFEYTKAFHYNDVLPWYYDCNLTLEECERTWYKCFYRK